MKVKNQQPIYFFSDAGRAQCLELSEDPSERIYEIPIFREGQFEHYWYGDLDFDLEYLMQIVNNHDNRILSVDVAFDPDHRPEDGALAWVQPNGLSIRPMILDSPEGARSVNVLFAKIKYTPEGVDTILTKKKFKYFSSEINSDYSSKEKVKRSDGTTVKTSYGPTLIGGGFTNRPFISHLGSVFSLSGVTEQEAKNREVETVTSRLYNNSIDMAFASYRFADIASNDEPEPDSAEEELLTDEGLQQEEEQEIQLKKVENQSTVAQDLDSERRIENNTVLKDDEGEKKMKFSQLILELSKMTDYKARVAFIQQAEVATDEEAAREQLLASEERAYNASLLAEEQTRLAHQASEQVERLRQENITLSQSVLHAREDSYQNRVKAFSSHLVTEGHFPALINAATEMLTGLQPTERTQKFSVPGEEQPVDLIKVFSKIFSNIPKSHRVPEPTDIEPTAPSAEPQEQETEENIEMSDQDLKVEKYKNLYGVEPEEKMLQFIKDNGDLDLPAFLASQG
jgi:hypothetical protein